MSVVIKVENLSKQYRLGQVGTGTIRDDMKRWWASVRGKEDPFLRIGDVNNREEKGDSDYVWALKDLNFEVKESEVLGIIGKNGAGKSTLLKILSKVTNPTTGSIKVKGRVASLLEVGTGFHAELSGRENIFQNGAILGMTKREIKFKFDEIVDFSGVAKYIDTPVKRYSSGMYVRLAFAIAAHLEPEILIVDEVLAVGDAEFQKKCLGKMKDVSRQGRTVLFVSHNMSAVRNLCTRALVLEAGQVVLDGDVSKCIDEYLKSGTDVLEEGIIPENASSHSTEFAKFKRVIIRNNNDESVNTLYYEQNFVVEIELEVYCDIENAIIDFSIGTLENRITYTSTFDISKKNIFLKQGRHCFSVEMNPNLLPGNYNFYLGVHDMSKGGNTLHLVEKVKLISVLSVTENNTSRFPMNVSFGNIRIDGNWIIKN